MPTWTDRTRGLHIATTEAPRYVSCHWNATVTSWPALTNLALSSLAIATTWGALALVLLGVGLGWFRLMGAATPRGQEWFLAFWAGFATTLLILQGWHFLAPINGAVLALIVLIGIAGWWSYRGRFAELARASSLGGASSEDAER